VGKGIAFIGMLIVGAAAARSQTLAAQEPLAPTGPVSYWKFDEAAGGTTAANSVTGMPAATYVGAITVSNSAPPVITFPDPHSISANGSSAALSVPNFGSFPLMSVSAWVQRTGTTGSRQSIVSYKEGNGVNQGFVLCMNENGSSEYPRIFVQVNGGWQYTEATAAVPQGVWTHLVGTYDGTNITLYMDGAQVAQTGASGSMTNTGSQTTGIGVRASLDTNWVPGLIDDVRIYSRALTPVEVAVLALGCPVPTTLQAVPGAGQVSLSWAAPSGPAASYQYNIKRGTVSGTYTTIQMGVSGTTYVDTTAVNGTPYFYVVSATSAGESGNSNEVTCRPNPIQITPGVVSVVEAGGTATVTVTLLAGLQAGQTVTIPISSADPTAGRVSVGTGTPAASTSLVFSGATGNTQTFTVTGVSDHIAADPKTFHITFGTVSSGDATYSGINYLDDVICNQTESDLPGVIVTPTSGLSTVNGGPQVSFTVQLATIPSSAVSIPLAVAIPAGGTTEATVAGPGGLTQLNFTGGPTSNWNVPQTVFITPLAIDPSTTYVTSYAILLGPVSSGDSNYGGLSIPPVPVSEGTSTPPLPKVWSSHCGLLGVDLLILPALLAFWRRRARRPGGSARPR